MSSKHKYIIYGPGSALKRIPVQLFEEVEPSYTYEYSSDVHNDSIWVAVFEEYEKQINASVTLTCIFSFTGKQTVFECAKTGGRVGFRGSSLMDEKRTIEDKVIKFIQDYSKKFGLSVQKQEKQEPEQNNSEE